MKVKVLVVGSGVVGDHDATGKTLDNLFNNIPECDLLEYCLDYDSSYHTPSIDVIYESIHSNLVFYVIKQIYRKIFHTKDNPQAIKKGITSPDSNNKNDPLKKKIIVAGICLIDSIRHHVSKDDMMKIKKFDPDLLYLNGGTLTTMSISYYLSKTLDIPVVFHMMDNWYDSKYCGNLLTYQSRKKLVKLTGLLHERSIVNIAIGEKMANYYTLKFNKEYRYAMNCVNNIYFSKINNNNPVKLLFSGGLHGGRAESLRLVDQLLEKINKYEVRVKLYIYTSSVEMNRYRKYYSSFTELYSFVPENELFKNLAKADILLHVESFDDTNIEFFEYSMSTKIPEYLSVGRPILCFGPMEIATVEYIHKNNVGLVCNNKKELEENLVKLLNNKNICEKMASNALKIAKKNHLQSSVTKTIKMIFEDTVNGWEKNKGKML